MASTASTLLRLEKMATSENNGTWGNKANVNLDIVEAAITGVFAIATTGGDTTLANVDYTADDAKNRTIVVTGTLTSAVNIIIPNLKRHYRVYNKTSGAFAVKIKTSGGTGIEVTQTTCADIGCDGANVCSYASPMVNYNTGAPATASGAAANAVSVTPTGNLASTDAQAALAELQGDIDTINALLISSYQPLAARLTDIAAVAATKGNLYVGNGTNIAALGVGSNDQVLVAKSGAANGLAWAPLTPAGTVSVFYQASAPTGWTVDNSGGDTALRWVSGSSALGGSSGGSVAFTTAFSSARAITVDGHALTIGEIPSHNHTVTSAGTRAGSQTANPNGNFYGSSGDIGNFGAVSMLSDSKGGSGAHSHTGSVNLAVAYRNVIMATKAAY
jgi:hypothetical protein